jgi:mannitol-1-phosphate 5-dehydrogenase
MSLYVHFGAGNIGRALAGPLFSNAGYDVLFVDAYRPVVEKLHNRGGYKIVVKDELAPGDNGVIEVKGVDAITVDDSAAVREAVKRADLIGTAVGSAHIESVLKSMTPGIIARNGRPLSILFCENFNGVAKFARSRFRGWLPENFDLNRMLGLVETSIGKMVPLMPVEVRRSDPLSVWAEAYNRIIADRNGFVGFVPEGVDGLDLKNNFQAYVERKLFIHNLGHATCACYGFQRDYHLICDAVHDCDIKRTTGSVMMECALALTRRWPVEFNTENQRAHVDDLLRRFGNRALGDTVYRVGRDLPRKLAPNDRFIGALRLVQEGGGDCTFIYSAIAAALRFKAADEDGEMYPPDHDFHERLKREGVERVLVDHCGLSAFDIQQVLNAVTL